LDKGGETQMSSIKEYARKLRERNKDLRMKDIEGLMSDLMKEMIQEVLQGEMDDHLGYRKHERSDSENSRNGSREKTFKTEIGELPLKIPRDRKSEFRPMLVNDLGSLSEGLEEKILALYARGLSTRDLNEHLAEMYGIEVSADLVSSITDRIYPKVQEWQNRQLEKIYPVVFFDCIHYSVRHEGRVIKKAVYICLAVDREGQKDILGMWVGDGAEGAKYWLTVANELRNRGVEDILIACMDGLTGLPDSIRAVFPKVEIQRCIVHQVRNSVKHVVWKDRKKVCADLRAIYSAPTEKAGYQALQDFKIQWDEKYPAISKSWEANWANLSTFFAYPKEVRKMIYTTNALENLNRQLRKVTKAKSVFPTDKSLEKSLFLAMENIMRKWIIPVRDWGLISSQLEIFFGERFKNI
jgi:putative transposase